MARRKPLEQPPEQPAEALKRDFRWLDMQLGALTITDEFAELRPIVIRMRADAAREVDPAERLRLAVECADVVRPLVRAKHGEQADFAIDGGIS